MLGVGTSSNYQGFQVVFGSSDVGTEVSSGLLVAFILAIAAAAAIIFGSLISLFGLGGAKLGGFLILIAGLAGIAAGIMFFCAIPLANPAMADSYTNSGSTVIASIVYKLDFGFILAGVSATLGGVIALLIGAKGVTAK